MKNIDSVQRDSVAARPRSNRASTWKHYTRLLSQSLVYTVLFAAIYWLSFQLRFDFATPDDFTLAFRRSLPWLLSIKLAIFFAHGCFHGSWKYVTLSDLSTLIQAALVSLAALALLDHFVFPYHIPRAIVVVDAGLTIGVVGFLRAAWRLRKEGVWSLSEKHDLPAAFVVGCSDDCGRLTQQINTQPDVGYRVSGFLSTDDRNIGQRLAHVPVLGHIDELVEIHARHGADNLLVPANGVSGQKLRELMGICETIGMELRILAAPQERLNGTRQIPLRRINIDDLLRRDPISLDTDAIEAAVTARTVMVTGAGGSIGSEICRQLMKFQPETLLLVEQAENSLFNIDRELKKQTAEIRVVPYIADVTDELRMKDIFRSHKVASVFHAAAHKHVPMMEANVGESLKNNVLGTKCVADAALDAGVDTFVLISTDKAVNPTSVMGVSKHLAERYVNSLDESCSTAFIVVRFGNVLASVGSVVPIFQEQIANGGPVTVTDERMRRYFMTIPEASQLVLQASVMGNGGEIFVFDMGEPVKIVDLARDLIRLSGLNDDAIEIVYSGIRPGEKLYEELYFSEEDTLPTRHPKVRAAYHRHFSPESVSEMIQAIRDAEGQPEQEIRIVLKAFVPEYQSSAPSHRSERPAQTNSLN